MPLSNAPDSPSTGLKLAQIGGLLLASGLFFTWDRWPITHGSGVARHADSNLVTLVALAALAGSAAGLVVAYRLTDAWLDAHTHAFVGNAFRLVIGVALCLTILIAMAEGFQPGG